MYILTIWKFVFDIIRIFFFTIDKIVFNFIPTIYDLLLSIARTSILSQADILEMADRIYKLLAVFMVFKVTFSLIMYVVNPDDFSDKSKGLGKLGTNIVISLTLLILTPYIFNYAYRLQTIVLEDNALMSLVFGDEDGNSSRSVLNSAGEEMAFTTLIPFFMPDVSNEKLLDCVDLTSNIDTCADQMINITSTTSIAGNEEKKYETDINNYREGIRHKSLGLTLRSDMVNITETGTDNYIINYKPIISTAVGVIVILLLITFCIDVALRSVKLAFLQLIAPIPIISYVDPKSGKDGMFKKWYEMCFKTYLSLFIRLLAIYFAIYIIGKTDKLVDIVDGSKVTNFYIHIFIIIGALMFAKQFPEILKGLGIKLDGDGKFFLNPLKKVEEQALGGKQIIGAGAAGLAGAAAIGSNLATGAQRIKDAKGFWGKAKEVLKTPFGAVAGGISATSRGLVGAAKGEKFGKNFSNSYGTAMKNKMSRQDRQDDGVSWGEMMSSRFQQTVGLHSKHEAVEAAQKHIKNIQEAYKTIRSQAEAMDKFVTFKIDDLGLDAARAIGNEEVQQFRSMDFKGIKDLSKFKEQVAGTPITRNDGESDAEFLKRQQQHQQLLLDIDDAIDKRINQLADGTVETTDPATDKAIRDGYATMQRETAAFNSSINSIDPGVGTIASGDAKTINGSSRGAQARLQVSSETQHAEKVQQYGRKKDQK